MKSRSLLKSGSGVAPPHPARPAALPGLSFGLGTASAAAESLHDGTDPEARPSAFWRKVRDSGAGEMEVEWSFESGALGLRPLNHRARQSLPLVGLTGPSFGHVVGSAGAETF